MLFMWISCLCVAALWARGVDGIVDGSEVYPPGSYPFHCGVQFGEDWCGCVVLTSQHVLTAARCASQPISNFRILLGVIDRVTQSGGQAEVQTLSAVTRHPDYRPIEGEGYPADLAVLTLSTPVEASNLYIEPGQLAPAGNETEVDFVGQYCHIIGWGQTSGDSEFVNVLRETPIDVILNDECEPLFPFIPILSDKICVYDTARQLKGACYGDEGSAVVCKETAESTSWTVAGISSFFRTGCNTMWPSVYTRLSNYRQWIEEQVGGLPLLVNF